MDSDGTSTTLIGRDAVPVVELTVGLETEEVGSWYEGSFESLI